MKFDKVSRCYNVLFSFLALTLHKTQQELTKRNVVVTEFMISVSPKQKIVPCRVPSNINLGISVCSFDV